MESENLFSVDSSESSQSISSRRNSKWDITKEQLEYELFTLGLNKKEIARKYGRSACNVGAYFRKFGIKRTDSIKYVSSPQVRKLRREGTELTSRQCSIIVGSILGDGSIGKMKHISTKNAVLGIYQCYRRRAYLLWKARELVPFTRNIYQSEYGTYFASTCKHPVFNKYYDLFWKDGRKTVPPNIEDLLDDLALAVWYMDDGFTDASSSSIATCSFTIEENELLLKALKSKFGIEGRVLTMGVKYKGERRIYPYLSFRREGHRIFHQVVDPLLHECFEYKKLRKKTTQRPIRRAPLTEDEDTVRTA